MSSFSFKCIIKRMYNLTGQISFLERMQPSFEHSFTIMYANEPSCLKYFPNKNPQSSARRTKHGLEREKNQLVHSKKIHLVKQN